MVSEAFEWNNNIDGGGWNEQNINKQIVVIALVGNESEWVELDCIGLLALVSGREKDWLGGREGVV